MKFKCICYVLNCILLLSLSSQAYAGDPTHWVGAKSDNVYENNWQDAGSGRDAVCGGFVNKMDTYTDSTRKYWTSLTSQAAFHEGTDANGYGLDTVDIVMICTHGGAWASPYRFTQVLYYENTRAFSNQMRLGDDGRGLSVYSTFSCNTMVRATSDWSDISGRWLPLFNGGLRIATGFYDSAYSSNSTGSGTKYAELLHTSNKTIRSAWMDAMDDYEDNTPKLLSSGDSNYANSTSHARSCAHRLVYMTLHNYMTYSRLTDSDNLHLCSYSISSTD